MALAIDGGTPVRSRELPSVMNSAGRTFGSEEEDAVVSVLRSGMLSAVWGTEAKTLAREFGALTGAAHTVTCSSGTAALHLAVAAVDPAPGDEIIVPPITDMGSVLPILAQNAIPVFADVDPMTGCIDPASVRSLITGRTRAIMAVHLFGKAADIHELRRIADDAGVVLIEDCAQAYLTHSSPDDEAPLVGTVGHLGCFSLQQSKHITAGDGGLVITDDPVLAERMRLFADKGWPRESGQRAYLSFALNYRMTELVAAVARAQLGKLAGVVERRRDSARRVCEALRDVAGLRLPDIGPDHSVWYLPLMLDDATRQQRDRFADALTAEGIPAKAGYLDRVLYVEPLLRDQTMYGGSGYPLRGVRDYPDGLAPVAERLVSQSLITLQWNENYTSDDEADIITAIRKVYEAVMTP